MYINGLDRRDVAVEEFYNSSPSKEAAFAIKLVHTPSGLIVSHSGRLKDSYNIRRTAWSELKAGFTAWLTEEQESRKEEA